MINFYLNRLWSFPAKLLCFINY